MLHFSRSEMDPRDVTLKCAVCAEPPSRHRTVAWNTESGELLACCVPCLLRGAIAAAKAEVK